MDDGKLEEETARPSQFIDPILIVAAPRSGSSVLFGVLSSHPDLWSLHREDRRILEGPFRPGSEGRDSHALTADDLSDGSRIRLQAEYFQRVGNVEVLPFGRTMPLRGRGRGRVPNGIALLSRPFKHPPLRLVEKDTRTPLRITFMEQLFPGARFLYLTRSPRGNLASMYRDWQNPERTGGYPLPDGFQLADLGGTQWKFVLPPGWRRYEGRSVMEVCAFQWNACHEAAIRDLATFPSERVRRVQFEDLLAEPGEVLAGIARWARLDPRPLTRFAERLPVINARTRPDPTRWPNLEHELDATMPDVAVTASRLGYAVEA